jgi:murein DD-endopeptidase MepM/ murein hydrolase activator NlpD
MNRYILRLPVLALVLCGMAPFLAGCATLNQFRLSGKAPECKEDHLLSFLPQPLHFHHYGDPDASLKAEQANNASLQAAIADWEARKLKLATKSEEVSEKFLAGATVPSAWPVEHPKRRLSSGFGWRGRGAHRGVDITCPKGTPVEATAAGHVIFAGNVSGYGLIIKIEHEDGYETWYAHLQSCSRGPGSQVGQKEVIGTAGQTGRATTPHVHYEVRRNGKPVNPAPFLPNE